MSDEVNTRMGRKDGWLIPAVKGIPPKRSFLLLIAISDHIDKTIGDLTNPRPDAEKLSKVLREKYGFQEKVIKYHDVESLLKDKAASLAAAKDGLTIELFDEDVAFKKIKKTFDLVAECITKDDDLVVFFAGHSIQLKSESKVQDTFWVVNNELNISLEEMRKDYEYSLFYSYSKLKSVLELLSEKCRNLLLINDTCFGGSILATGVEKTRGTAEEGSRCYKCISSGAPYQPVSDGKKGEASPFMKLLLKKLEDNYSEHLSSEKLFFEIKPHLQGEKKLGQVAQYGALQFEKKGFADFTFFLKNREGIDLPDNEVVKTEIVSKLNFKKQIIAFEDDDDGFLSKDDLFNFFVLVGTSKCGHKMLIERMLPKALNNLEYYKFKYSIEHSEAGALLSSFATNETSVTTPPSKVWDWLGKEFKRNDDLSFLVNTSAAVSPAELMDALVKKLRDRHLLIFLEIGESVPIASQETELAKFWTELNALLTSIDINTKETLQRIFFVVLDFRGKSAEEYWNNKKDDLKTGIHKNSKPILFPMISLVNQRVFTRWTDKIDPALRTAVAALLEQEEEEYIQPVVKKICDQYGFDKVEKRFNPYFQIFGESHF